MDASFSVQIDLRPNALSHFVTMQGSWPAVPGTRFEAPDQRTAFMKTLQLFLIILLAAGLLSCSGRQTGARKFTIAVVPKGTTHPFWKSVNAGATKAANDFKAQGVDVDLIWKGPLREDDREQQVQVVEGFVSQGVNGIVLAPLDSKALIRPVEEAKKAGIPTAIIDSALESDKITSFAATDNRKGGNM